jgi:hypothetical protein
LVKRLSLPKLNLRLRNCIVDAKPVKKRKAQFLLAFINMLQLPIQTLQHTILFHFHGKLSFLFPSPVIFVSK